MKGWLSRYWPAALSGLLLVLAYPGVEIPGLKWVALLPLIYSLNRVKNYRQAYLATFITSCIFIGYVWSWYYSTLPLTWTGLQNQKLGLVLVTFVWIIVFGFMALVFAWVGPIYVRLKKGNWSDPLVLGLIWTGFEIVRNYTFSIYSWGNYAHFGQFYSFGSLGYALNNNKLLIALSSLGGVYLLTFIVVLINGLIYKCLKFEKDEPTGIKLKPSLVTAGIFVLLLLCGYGITKLNQTTPTRTIKYGGLQANFDPSAKLDLKYFQEVNQKYYLGVQYLVQSQKPDLVILPEDSRFLTGLNAVDRSKLTNYLGPLLADPNRVIILTNRTETDTRPFNTTYSITQSQGIVDTYQKNFLVPLGENIPFHLEKIFGLIAGDAKWFKEYKSNRVYQAGSEVKPLNTPLGLIASLSCSEIYATDIIGPMVKKGGQLIVTPTNDAIFHGSPTLLAQNEAVSKVRAAETNRYLIQVVNGGYSFTVNNQGQVVNKINRIEPAYLVGEVPLLSGKTPYVRFGNWPAWLSVIIISILLLLSFIGMRKKKPKGKKPAPAAPAKQEDSKPKRPKPPQKPMQMG